MGSQQINKMNKKSVLNAKSHKKLKIEKKFTFKNFKSQIA